MTSRARLLWLLFALAGALVAIGVGCTLLNPLDGYGPPRADAGDALAPDAGDGGDGGCARKTWPPRPDGGSANVLPDIVLALRTFDMAKSTGAAIDNYDLDGLCTCPDPGSCTPALGVRQACDGPGGSDNAGGQLVVTLTRLAGKGLFDVSGRLERGRYGMVVRLRGWNGEPNDPEVEVAVFISNGVEGIQDGGTPKPPAWDGTDQWTLEPRGLFGGTGPPFVSKFTDPKGYVVGGMVVSTTSSFTLSMGNLSLDFVDTAFTAKINKTGAGYRLDEGLMAGRLPVRSFLKALEVVPDPLVDGGYLCGDASQGYDDFKGQACGAADLMSRPLDDRTGKTCDAVGFAAAFTAEAAQLGSLYQDPLPFAGCGPGWQDDCPH